MARSGVTTGSLRCAAVPQAPWTGPTGTAAIDPRYGSGRLGALLRRSSPLAGSSVITVATTPSAWRST